MIPMLIKLYLSPISIVSDAVPSVMLRLLGFPSSLRTVELSNPSKSFLSSNSPSGVSMLEFSLCLDDAKVDRRQQFNSCSDRS